MPRKKKLGPVDVELSHEDFFPSLKALLKAPAAGPLLDHLREEFREERNPLAAWEALLVARTARVAVPEWVLRYLERAARRLFAPDSPPRAAAARVVSALGLDTRGKGNAFSRYFDLHDMERVVKAVYREIRRDPSKTLEQACGKVAEDLDDRGENVSNVTIEKWVKEYRQRLLPKAYRPPSK